MMSNFRGVCTRKVQIENPDEIDYYQIGKVFRFRNIVSAVVGKAEANQEYQTKKTNVVFHIFSQ